MTRISDEDLSGFFFKNDVNYHPDLTFLDNFVDFFIFLMRGETKRKRLVELHEMIYGDHSNNVKLQGFCLLRDSVQPHFRSRFGVSVSADEVNNETTYCFCFSYEGIPIIKIPVMDVFESDICLESDFRSLGFVNKDNVIGALVTCFYIWIETLLFDIKEDNEGSSSPGESASLDASTSNIKSKGERTSVNREEHIPSAEIYSTSSVSGCAGITERTLIHNEQSDEKTVQELGNVLRCISLFLQRTYPIERHRQQYNKDNYEGLLARFLKVKIFLHKISNGVDDKDEHQVYLCNMLLSCVDDFYFEVENIFSSITNAMKLHQERVSPYKKAVADILSLIRFHEENREVGEPTLVSIERTSDYERDYGIYYSSRICLRQKNLRLGDACYIPASLDFLVRYYLVAEDYSLPNTTVASSLGHYQLFHFASDLSQSEFISEFG